MNDEQQTHQEQGSDEEPASEQIVEEPSRERDRDQHEQPSKPLIQQWLDLEIDRRVESFVAVLGLIIGIFVAYLALNQLSAMREQTESMKGQLAEMKTGSADTKTIAESAKTQADNTHKLADATEKMAEATRGNVAQAKTSLEAYIETARLDQRAWVGVQAMNLNMAVGKPITASVHYINSGRTPSTKVTAAIHARYSSQAITNIDEIGASFKNVRRPTSILMPNQQTHTQVTVGLEPTQDNIEAIRKGKIIVYIFGEIYYRDVFKQNHITFFCGQYNPASGASGALNNCDQHNYAD